MEFKNNVSYEWEDIYEVMKGKPLEQIGFEQSGFEFFLDMGYEEKDEQGNLMEWQNERVVAIAGFSKKDNDT